MHDRFDPRRFRWALAFFVSYGILLVGGLIWLFTRKCMIMIWTLGIMAGCLAIIGIVVILSDFLRSED